MKLSARIDIDLPRDRVFAAASDFAAAEARLSARGVEIRRTVDRVPPGPGLAWAARARLRGRMRDVASELVSHAPPDGFAIRSRIGGMTVTFDLRLVAIAPGRTRVIAGVDLRAETLKARMVLQVLRLSKRRAEDRLSRGLAAWASELLRDGQ